MVSKTTKRKFKKDFSFISPICDQRGSRLPAEQWTCKWDFLHFSLASSSLITHHQQHHHSHHQHQRIHLLQRHDLPMPMLPFSFSPPLKPTTLTVISLLGPLVIIMRMLMLNWSMIFWSWWWQCSLTPSQLTPLFEVSARLKIKKVKYQTFVLRNYFLVLHIRPPKTRRIVCKHSLTPCRM